MKILVEISDNKLSFALEVIRSLIFVKKAEPVSGEKYLLMEELKEAVDNLKLVKEGKLEAKPARQLLNEL